MKVWEVSNGSKGQYCLERQEGSQSFLKHQEPARCEELALFVNQKLYQGNFSSKNITMLKPII